MIPLTRYLTKMPNLISSISSASSHNNETPRYLPNFQPLPQVELLPRRQYRKFHSSSSNSQDNHHNEYWRLKAEVIAIIPLVVIVYGVYRVTKPDSIYYNNLFDQPKRYSISPSRIKTELKHFREALENDQIVIILSVIRRNIPINGLGTTYWHELTNYRGSHFSTISKEMHRFKDKIGKRDLNNKTPLILAITKNNLGAVNLLLEHDAFLLSFFVYQSLGWSYCREYNLPTGKAITYKELAQAILAKLNQSTSNENEKKSMEDIISVLEAKEKIQLESAKEVKEVKSLKLENLQISMSAYKHYASENKLTPHHNHVFAASIEDLINSSDLTLQKFVEIIYINMEKVAESLPDKDLQCFWDKSFSLAKFFVNGDKNLEASIYCSWKANKFLSYETKPHIY